MNYFWFFTTKIWWFRRLSIAKEKKREKKRRKKKKGRESRDETEEDIDDTADEDEEEDKLPENWSWPGLDPQAERPKQQKPKEKKKKRKKSGDWDGTEDETDLDDEVSYLNVILLSF